MENLTISNQGEENAAWRGSAAGGVRAGELRVGHGAWPGCHLAATSWVLPTVQEAKPYPTSIASTVTRSEHLDQVDSFAISREHEVLLGGIWGLARKCSLTASLGWQNL